MTGKLIVAASALVCVVAVILLLKPPGSGPQIAPATATSGPPPAASSPDAVVVMPSTPPPVSPAEVSRQDRVSRAHQRREQATFDNRPLLIELPLEIDGVLIDIAGLAPDGRTTLLNVESRRIGVRKARAAYQRALAEHGDSGRAYRIVFLR